METKEEVIEVRAIVTCLLSGRPLVRCWLKDSKTKAREVAMAEFSFVRTVWMVQRVAVLISRL